MLIASRVVEGLGSAMIFGTSIAILTSVFPAQERGKVLGINVAIVYLGLSMGPLLGGIITAYAGWRFIYAGITIYALLAALLAQRMINCEWRCAQEGRFDIFGTILYAAMLSALMYGLTLIPDIKGAYLLGLALAIMAVFFRWELRNENPVLKISVFRNNTVFLFSNLAALINYSATAALAFLLSLYLQYMKGYGPESDRSDSDRSANSAGCPLPTGRKAVGQSGAEDRGLRWNGPLRGRAHSLRLSDAADPH